MYSEKKTCWYTIPFTFNRMCKPNSDLLTFRGQSKTADILMAILAVVQTACVGSDVLAD